MSYQRDVLFALELIDAVTLQRVSQGVTVAAEGLRGTPVISASGLFVWLLEEIAPLRQITVDTGRLPLHAEPVAASELIRPLMSLQLSPAAGYPFDAGTTALRSTLLKSRDPEVKPIVGAQVRLVWLDDDGSTWRDAPTGSRTSQSGAFAALLRLAPSDRPFLDANGALSVRLLARRDGATERSTSAFVIPQGRVTDAPAFLWDDLTP